MADKTSRSAALRLASPRDCGTAVLALRPAPVPRAANVKWSENVATVAVRGDLDRDALWAIDYTIGRAAIEAGRIVLDLRDVTHLDYTGVPELVARRKELLARGGDLLVAVKNPYVRNILRAQAGTDLPLCSSPDEALAPAHALAPARLSRRGA